jgi:hypothetical protein
MTTTMRIVRQPFKKEISNIFMEKSTTPMMPAPFVLYG